MFTPVLADDALLADIAAARALVDELHLWWLGQSGFLVQFAERHLLLDPYLSDSLTKKYSETDKPHVRMTALCIDPARLNFVDAITSSHNHTDHLDAETLLPLVKANPGVALIVGEANRQFAADRLGLPIERLVGIDDGVSFEVAGFRITGVPAAHDAIEQDEAGHQRFLGYVVECGPWKIYHSGDTRLYDGMEERLQPFGVDVALLPINGAAPERRVAGNLNGREAAGLAKAIGAGVAIPCHYEMFEFNTASPEEFVAEAARLEQRVTVVRCGERFTLRAGCN
jgi:L-ascorbate metabolism protein UlaG (beta-lactamase superfamily)